MEPLLGPISALDLTGIDWVIVGGESGPRARPLQPEWVIEIKERCQKAKIPFFFKQWGGVNKKKRGRLLEGRLWNQMPETGINLPEADLACIMWLGLNPGHDIHFLIPSWMIYQRERVGNDFGVKGDSSRAVPYG